MIEPCAAAVPSKTRNHPLVMSLLVVTLLLALGVRLLYVRAVSPFLDEYISMLAMRSVLERGIPVLPSGLLYGPKAIVHTYLGALSLWIFANPEFSTRFPSVLAGVALVACVYRVGRNWFSVPAGLSAAIALAWSPSAVEWGGRARMYSLFLLLSLLGGYLLITGCLKATNRRWQAMAILIVVLTVFTQALGLIVMAALLAAGVITRLILPHKSGPRISLSRWEVLTGLILLMAAVVFWLPGPWGLPIEISDLAPKSMDIQERALYLIAFTHQFVVWPLWPLTILYVVGFLKLVLRLLRKSLIYGDREALALYLGLLFAWVVTSILARFQSDRYLSGIVPFYFLLAVRELSLFAETVWSSVKSTSSHAHAIANWGSGYLVVLALLAPSTIQLLSQDPYGFAPAFEYVRDNWHSGDVILTCSPAPSQLFLGRTDYYVIQNGAESYRGMDIWTGAPLIDTTDGFLIAMKNHPRAWFVVEKLCWERHFDEKFQAVVRQNMRIVLDQQGMLVFASHTQ